MSSLPRWLLLALGVLALVASTGCTTEYTVLARREPTPHIPHFKVMTFNIHRERAGDAATVDAVGAPDAEIVCLQEVTSEWARVLRERYATQYPYMLFAPQENAGGLAILSRFPLVDDGVIPVPGGWHPAWHVFVEAPEGRLQLLHVHLRSLFNGNSNVLSNWFNSGKDHVWQIDMFMKQALPDLPTLVVGDFNEPPKGKAVRWLEARGYQNALRLFKPKEHTWRGRSLTRMVKMTIDHVMFDSSFEPLDAWVAGRGGSDHYPVVAHFEVPAWAISSTSAALRTQTSEAPKNEAHVEEEADDSTLELDLEPDAESPFLPDGADALEAPPE